MTRRSPACLRLGSAVCGGAALDRVPPLVHEDAEGEAPLEQAGEAPVGVAPRVGRWYRGPAAAQPRLLRLVAELDEPERAGRAAQHAEVDVGRQVLAAGCRERVAARLPPT